MKIGVKLALLFTTITVSILAVFSFILYTSTAQNREKEFYNTLKNEAVTKARLFLQARIEAKTLQKIYLHNRSTINEVEVAIYDTKYNLLYHDAVEIDVVKETPAMLAKIYERKQITFYQEKWQIMGLCYKEAGKDYIVTATAIDAKGYAELQNLQKTIIVLIVLAMVVCYAIGVIFSQRMLQPVRNITEKAHEITSTNLYLRIKTSQNKDEITELANTFNAMLNRLEASFESQKLFVSNISHEVRTPLAALITEIELCLSKERALQEYQKTLQNSLQDAYKMVKLSNDLLNFAKASYDASQITFRQVRIDEILLDAQEDVLKQHKNYQVSLAFENEIDNELVQGNEYLLKIAFSNLIENACKFSDDKYCVITIAYQQTHICISFQDEGIGITNQDLPHIFEPFYRGKNHTSTEGNGIGLALTQRIILLHGGIIHIKTQVGRGTCFNIQIPTLPKF
jgi:signal transduction histidine kinase